MDAEDHEINSFLGSLLRQWTLLSYIPKSFMDGVTLFYDFVSRCIISILVYIVRIKTNHKFEITNGFTRLGLLQITFKNI